MATDNDTTNASSSFNLFYLMIVDGNIIIVIDYDHYRFVLIARSKVANYIVMNFRLAPFEVVQRFDEFDL